MKDNLSGQDKQQLKRVKTIGYVLPIILFTIVIFYETWEHLILQGEIGFSFNLTFEVLFFGILGPSAVYITIKYIVALLAQQMEATVNLELVVAERTETLEERNAELATANQDLLKLDELKSDFVSMVSHELRGPLTTLNGGLELALQNSEEMTEESRRVLEVIAGESERLTEFVQTILDVSRLQAGKLNINLGPVAISPLLERSIHIAFAGKNREVIGGNDDQNLPPVWADEIYLEKVLYNLLTNADKYSPSEKPIKVTASLVDGFVEIEITDFGAGIPTAQQEIIFERFQRLESGNRLSAKGWGLGLYFSKALTEAQNCELRLKSPVRDDTKYPGTAFVLSIPLMKEVPEDG